MAKKRCQAKTKQGHRCKRYVAKSAIKYCKQHSKQKKTPRKANKSRSRRRNPRNPRKPRKSTKKEKIFLPTRLAAKELGCQIETLRRWARKGAPHRRAARGYLEFNISDVRNWLTRQRDIRGTTQSLTGHSVSVPRVPLSVAQPILRQVKEELGLTLSELAELLQIKRNTLVQYIGASKKTGSVPREVVTRAEFLHESLPAKRHRETQPTKQQVKDALQRERGVRWQARKRLGVGFKTLNSLIETYDLWEYVKSKAYSERFTEKEILDALQQASGNKSQAARILGISRHAFLSLLKTANIESQQTYGLQREEVVSALRQAEGSRKYAAQILGVAANTVGHAIKRFGLEEEFPLRTKMPPPEEVARILEESGTQVEAARRIGVHPTYLSRFIKRYGIR